MTVIESEQHGKLAALVHDRGMLPDPALLTSVLAAARLALERNVLQTEVRARVAELERERDFIRDVVNAAPAFFAVADLDGQIVRFNDALVTASGIRGDERVRGRSFATVFVSDRDRAEVRRLIAARARGPYEHHWLGRDTTDLVVKWSSTPINDKHGNPRLLITGLDVSDRARHEEELRREHDFLSSVGRATPSLLCVVHADGTVDRRGVNRAFAAATGIDDAVAVGAAARAPRRAIDLIDTGELSKGHGKALLTEPGHHRRRMLARHAVEHAWSVRALEAEIARRPRPSRSSVPADHAAAAARLEDAITRAIGCDVRARPHRHGYQSSSTTTAHSASRSSSRPLEAAQATIGDSRTADNQ